MWSHATFTIVCIASCISIDLDVNSTLGQTSPSSRNKCPFGSYGPACILQCSSNCAGEHHECDPRDGWCVYGCTKGRYGRDCSMRCANCEVGECHRTDGTCLQVKNIKEAPEENLKQASTQGVFDLRKSHISYILTLAGPLLILFVAVLIIRACVIRNGEHVQPDAVRPSNLRTADSMLCKESEESLGKVTVIQVDSHTNLGVPGGMKFDALRWCGLQRKSVDMISLSSNPSNVEKSRFSLRPSTCERLSKVDESPADSKTYCADGESSSSITSYFSG